MFTCHLGALKRLQKPVIRPRAGESADSSSASEEEDNEKAVELKSKPIGGRMVDYGYEHLDNEDDGDANKESGDWKVFMNRFEKKQGKKAKQSEGGFDRYVPGARSRKHGVSYVSTDGYC